MFKTRAEACWENPREVTLLLRNNRVRAIEWNYIDDETGSANRAHLSKTDGRLELYVTANKITRLLYTSTHAVVGPVPVSEILGHEVDGVETKLAVENIQSQRDMYLDPRHISKYQLN